MLAGSSGLKGNEIEKEMPKDIGNLESSTSPAQEILKKCGSACDRAGKSLDKLDDMTGGGTKTD
jgi:hypothetical protein